MNKSIYLPGDKSISHRVAILAALADNICTIANFNTGADCFSTLRCLSAVGIEVNRLDEIRPKPFQVPEHALDCGNSGSTMRMLTGLLAGQQIPAILTGDSSLLKRPMKRVAEPLRQMGSILELENDEYAPIRLIGGVKQAIEYTMPVSSAQVKSAVLFAGLRLAGTRVIEPVPTRDHTERLFQHLQIEPGPTVKIPAFTYSVPGDPSSAAFLIIAALIHKKEMLLKNVLLNRHRIGFLRVLQKAGASVLVVDERIQQNEFVGNIQIGSQSLTEAIVVAADEVASVIDEIPALTVAGLKCGFEVHGAKELRYKESDRIAAMTSNLRKLGFKVEEWHEGYRVYPGKPQPCMVTTFGDHRIAMAFSVAGFNVDDPNCVTVSFPEFFDLLNRIVL